MEWLNIYGIILIAVIMIPNIIFAIKCKEGFENNYKNKAIEVMEQIGRFGCFIFMCINIPGTVLGSWFNEAFVVYLAVNGLLATGYCVLWIYFFKRAGVGRALALSIIPSIIFLFSGIISRSVLLIVSSVLFAPSHILLSYKNAKYDM